MAQISKIISSTEKAQLGEFLCSTPEQICAVANATVKNNLFQDNYGTRILVRLNH